MKRGHRSGTVSWSRLLAAPTIKSRHAEAAFDYLVTLIDNARETANVVTVMGASAEVPK